MNGRQSGGPALDALSELLQSAKHLGFVGPGPVTAHIEHGLAFGCALTWGWSRPSVLEGARSPSATRDPHVRSTRHPEVLADLGSGAGLPGLVLATIWPDAHVLLIEAGERRAVFLEHAVHRLRLGDRAHVVCERAEALGRLPDDRGGFEAVVARAFARPAVTAECAAPLLATGGILAVSEPPSLGASDARWPAEGLAQLGLGPAMAYGENYHFVLVAQELACPERYPRRVGIPDKRPLF